MAVISKGLELWVESDIIAITYGEADALTGEISPVESEVAYKGAQYSLVNGLQEIGELNGLGTSAEREKIEVTTLKDDRHVYVDGIIADSDVEGIEFKFLYDAHLFNAIKNLINYNLDSGDKNNFVISIDREEGTKSGSTYAVPTESFKAFASWKGIFSGIKVDSVAVNSALTMTVTITPEGAIGLEE